MTAAVRLAEALIACRSVTPADGGCQALLAQGLAAAGFETNGAASAEEALRLIELLLAVQPAHAEARRLQSFLRAQGGGGAP